MVNKIILSMISTASLCISSTLNFSDATKALDLDKRINDGKYQNEYHTWGNGTTVLIEKDKFFIFNDTPDDQKGLVSESGFRYVKSGIFYSSYSKKYYCLIDTQIIKAQENNLSFEFYCTRSGWKTRNK